MSGHVKILVRILRGASDANIPFVRCALLVTEPGVSGAHPWKSPQLYQGRNERDIESTAKRWWQGKALSGQAGQTNNPKV